MQSDKICVLSLVLNVTRFSTLFFIIFENTVQYLC